MTYIANTTIQNLRKRKQMTQRQLADCLKVSDKTISKWETGKGLPDIGIIPELANALGVSITELFTGECADNRNRSANMRKSVFYLCPVCGNIIQSVGSGTYSCCGIVLPELEIEDTDQDHSIHVEVIDNEYYVSLEHEMTKNHFLSFMVYVTTNMVQLVKLYPEQNAEARFPKRGHGFLYIYCNRHGLYRKTI